MDNEAPAIGIDLGTTNACAAVLINDKIKLIRGDDGVNIMSSYVFFENCGDRLVGNLAKDRSYKNPKNAIFGVKRFIGRCFKEFQDEKCLSMFPYTVQNIDDSPTIAVKYSNATKYFNPEEISAMVLGKLKEQAEESLGKKVTKAVITVPAHFNGTQRQATIDAGKIAGLKVLRIINEPTAAALAYELDNKYNSDNCNVLVYDFGGGTFDVSIVSICKDKIVVKASNGEPYLGGDDLNNNLLEYFLESFKDKNKIDLKKRCKAIERLRNLSERTKIMLSTRMEYTAEADCIDNELNLDFECKVTRSLFEDLNIALFNKTLECVEKTLKDANIDKTEINEILLVGGSTRIPYVRNIIQNFFGKEPNATIHPDEAVAIGAARQAAISDGNTCLNAITSVMLSDICSLSLGIRVYGDIMVFMIPRNTQIPTKTTRELQTVFDYQKSIRINIYEGERPLCSDNKLLAEFKLMDIRVAPEGEVTFDVTFDIDENGLLTATVIEQGTNNTAQVLVNIYKNNLSQEEIQEMIARAEIFREEDDKKKSLAILRNNLDDIKYKVSRLINMTQSEKDSILSTHRIIVDWLETNVNISKTDIDKKIDIIEKDFFAIIKKYTR